MEGRKELLFLLILALASISHAYTNVTACMLTLNTAGETYHLINDINEVYVQACFTIDADNITLDCQGHQVLVAGSPGSETTFVINAKNATLQNCISLQGYANALDLEVNGNDSYISNFSGRAIVQVNSNIANTRMVNIRDSEYLVTLTGSSNVSITTGAFTSSGDYSQISGTNHTFTNVNFSTVETYDSLGTTFTGGKIDNVFIPHVSNTAYCPMTLTNLLGATGYPIAYVGRQDESLSFQELDSLFFCGHSETMSYGNTVHSSIQAILADGINLQQTTLNITRAGPWALVFQMNSSDIRGLRQVAGITTIYVYGKSNTFTDVSLSDCSGYDLITDTGTNNIYDNITTGSNCPNFYVGGQDTVKNSVFIYDVWSTGLTLNGSDTIFNNYFKSDYAYFVFNGANTLNTNKQLGTRISGPGNYIGGNYYTDSSSTGYSDTCTDADMDLFCDTPLTFNANNIDYLPYARPCIVITNSGTFTLLADVIPDKNYCIDIQSDNVVLDCAFHTVDAGVYLYPIAAGRAPGEGSITYNNVTIKNCKVIASTQPIEVNGDNDSVFNNLISAPDHNYINATGNSSFNVTKQSGTRVYSTGTQIGGNYFTDPSGTGYSDTCTDANADTFCDTPLDFNPSAPVPTCSGTPNCSSFLTNETCFDWVNGVFNLACMWTSTNYSCQGTCVPCADIKLPDYGLPAVSCAQMVGCSWNGTVCSGTCAPCNTITDVDNCTLQFNCFWTGNEPYTCQVADTCENLDQSGCENQPVCSFGMVTTYSSTTDFLPLANTPGGGGGGPTFTCPPGFSLCPDGVCKLNCAPPQPENKPPLQDIRDIYIFGIRLTIWLLLLAILIIVFDVEVIGEGKRASVLGLAGFLLLIFAIVVEAIPLLTGAGTL